MRKAVIRRLVTAVAVVAIAGIAVWHYWSLYDGLRGAKADLEAAQTHLGDVGLDLTRQDVDQGRKDLASARDNLAQARRHARWDPILQASRAVPRANDQVHAIDDILDMGTILIDIGDNALIAGDRAVAYRDRPSEGQPLTKSLVDLLAETSPEVERIDALTKELVAKRFEMGDRPLLPPLSRVRDRLDEELPTVANAVEQARQTKDLLPGFLGFEGDRRYLVFALNSGELLPGGGLVTSSGIMPVAEGVNGSLDFIDSTSWKARWEAKGGNYVEPPGPLKRYLLRDFTWNLLVSDWSPDFPTWSQQAREFYEMVHGEQRVDGIIAVDLTVLERLLTVTGPKTLDLAGYGPVTFTPSNAVLQLEALTRQPFEGTDDRKSVIATLAESLLADILHLPSDRWDEGVKVIRGLGAERHIQVLSFDAPEQTIIRDFGWDGALRKPKGDYLHFNEASVLSTKLSLIVQPFGKYTVDVSELGDARHELTLTYRNPLAEWAADKHPDLVSQLMLGGLYGGYLRVFAPDGLTNAEVLIDGQPGNIEDRGTELGRDWFGTLLSLPPNQSRTVTMKWTEPLVATSEEYSLYIQKQPGTAGMCLDLQVLHGGKPARHVTIEGGTRDANGRVCLTSDVRVRADF